MGETAITADNISKLYHLGLKRSGGLRESFELTINRLLRRVEVSKKEFWALKDISFSVRKGEVLGIIGKNGAGKSTLLKILSRITEPTTGRIVIDGRVASLLEVGTGFHPELTGRENIYMNGSILGMKRREIKEKFDEITAFSGIEKFIDTPVKRYSSGMYVRLAFAVAAHLEPEILIVDEVLAVGDAEFQRKCLGKMKDVAGSGRTVLFVSHNMTALNSLCSRGLYLKEGKIESMGDIDAIVNEYLLKENAAVLEKSWAGAERPGDNIARLEHVRLIGRNGEKPHSILMNEAIGLEFTYEITEEGYFPTPNIHLFTSRQEHVLASHDKPRSGYHKKGRYRSVVWIPPDLLNEGTYIAGIALTTMNPARIHFYEPEAIIFEVLENTLIRDIEYNKRLPGVVRPKLDWSTEPV